MGDLLDGVTWFRGSSVRIQRAGLDIHVDPWGVPEGAEADYILLTHPHYDNFSEVDIERIRGPRTVVIAPASMRKQIRDADHLMRPGDLLQLEGFDVLAVPAYNHEKRFHPPEAGWLGYVFTLGGVTYFHAGDTDHLSSMEDIRCDVAFLPCDGHYTMGPEEAALAADAVDAERVVPIHWGDPSESGSRADAERLRDLIPGRVTILERPD